MTDFERKRLEYLIKAAKGGEWVKLGTADAQLFQLYGDFKKIWKEAKTQDSFLEDLKNELAAEQIPFDKPE